MFVIIPRSSFDESSSRIPYKLQERDTIYCDKSVPAPAP